MWSGRTMRQRLAERDCVMVCLPLFGGRLATALQGHTFSFSAAKPYRRTGKAFRRGGQIGSGTAGRRRGCR